MLCIWCWKKLRQQKNEDIRHWPEKWVAYFRAERASLQRSLLFILSFKWISVPWVLVDERRTILQMKKHTHSERHSKFSVNEQVFLRRKLTQKQIYFSFFCTEVDVVCSKLFSTEINNDLSFLRDVSSVFYLDIDGNTCMH